MEDRCIICGKIIPEGRQVCPGCEDCSEVTPINIGKEIDLEKIKRVAEIEGCVTKKSYFTGLLYATDYSDILIASSNGAIRIPIELIDRAQKELEVFAEATAKGVTELNASDKNTIARSKGISYGKFEAILGLLTNKEKEIKEEQ